MTQKKTQICKTQQEKNVVIPSEARDLLSARFAEDITFVASFAYPFTKGQSNSARSPN
jgi:hypothetical protein